MLSLHHKCIFIHIPKTAGQSVERAFLDDLGLGWSTRAPLLLRYNENPELGPPRLAHLTAREYVSKCYVPEDTFKEYYKFSVVRDPWSRTVSLYKYMRYFVPFRRFILDILPRRLWNDEYWFVRPQVEFLQDDAAQTLVDDVLRFENLKNDFDRVRKMLGLAGELPRVNSSSKTVSAPGPNRALRLLARSVVSGNVDLARSAIGRKQIYSDWRQYYDAETRDKVAELYARDIEAFGYTFDATTPAEPHRS
jgi:hypothetical protein